MTRQSSPASADSSLALRVSLRPPAGTDPERLEDLTLRLQNEIRALDVQSVERVRGGALPRGAKSGAAIELGALAVSVGPQLVEELFGLIKSWLSRPGNAGTSITVTDASGRTTTFTTSKALTPREGRGLIREMKKA